MLGRFAYTGGLFAFPLALCLLYLAFGALAAECCGVALPVPALALLDSEADFGLPSLLKAASALMLPVAVIDLIVAPSVLHL